MSTNQSEDNVEIGEKRKVPQELLDLFELLPTDKPNVSFSEVKCWIDCSWRHYLDTIKKLNPNLPGIFADYGTALHASHEKFILTKEIDKKLFVKMLYKLWKEHQNLDTEKYTIENFKEFVEAGKATLDELKEFYDTTFPGWTHVSAEELLFEQINNHPHAFKGYIDAIIKYPKGKKYLYVIIDAKSCGWGWTSEKKSDKNVQAQLILYKHYWTLKNKIDLKDTRCAFLLLKRTAKPGKRIEKVDVSVGEVSIKRSLNLIDNMIVSLKRGIRIKNRDSCKYCPYKDTEHCK